MALIQKILKAVKHGILRYEAARYTGRRRAAVVEFGGEDSALNIHDRSRLISLMRDGFRDAPQARALAQQMRVLTCGIEAGKLTLTTDDEKFNTEAMRYFSRWARHVDYQDGTDLCECSKLVLSELAFGGGDVALVFDDGILTGGDGTGKVLFFESDCIGEVKEGVLPAGHSQRQGVIYSPAQRAVGLVVSIAERGKGIFDEGKCLFLMRENPEAITNWKHIKRKYRFDQPRGISPHSAAIATLIDLHEIISSERQSAKTNAALVAQVLDQVGAPIAIGEEGQPQFDARPLTNGAGGIVLEPPPGAKLELLDTKRPNINMVPWSDWLLRSAASVHGLASVYGTMRAEASYTAFRGEQSITWGSIEEAQKQLERDLLDPLAVMVLRRAISLGEVAETKAEWESELKWAWPSMREVNEVDAQTALAAKLRNCVTSYRRVLGPGWLKTISEVAAEADELKKLGLTHPAHTTEPGAAIKEEGQGNED